MQVGIIAIKYSDHASDLTNDINNIEIINARKDKGIKKIHLRAFPKKESKNFSISLNG